MVQGSWVGALLPVSFFIFFVLFSGLFLSPYERIDCQGWGTKFRPLSLAPFFFFTLLTCVSFMFLFLVLVRIDYVGFLKAVKR